MKMVSWRIINPDLKVDRLSRASIPGSAEPMCYWWVNQNPTRGHEVQGGFLQGVK
jgi:hypothetical protein